MSAHQFSEANWKSVLLRAGRLDSRTNTVPRPNYIYKNEAYARSLSRAYLAELQPRVSAKHKLT